MKAKFDQHPTLKNKLLNYPKGNFYEATKDPKYGCGFFLNEASQAKEDSIKLTPNLTGKFLTNLRKFYEEEEA